MTPPESFTCSACGGVFACAATEAEADAEALAVWGVADASTKPEQMAIVCRDCFVAIMEWAEAQRMTPN